MPKYDHGHDHHDLTMIVNQVPDCLGEDHDGERLDRVLRRQQDDHRRPRHVEDVGLDCKSIHNDDGDDHDDDDHHDDHNYHDPGNKDMTTMTKLMFQAGGVVDGIPTNLLDAYPQVFPL